MSTTFSKKKTPTLKFPENQSSEIQVAPYRQQDGHGKARSWFSQLLCRYI